MHFLLHDFLEEYKNSEMEVIAILPAVTVYDIKNPHKLNWNQNWLTIYDSLTWQKIVNIGFQKIWPANIPAKQYKASSASQWMFTR